MFGRGLGVVGDDDWGLDVENICNINSATCSIGLADGELTLFLGVIPNHLIVVRKV